MHMLLLQLCSLIPQHTQGLFSLICCTKSSFCTACMFLYSRCSKGDGVCLTCVSVFVSAAFLFAFLSAFVRLCLFVPICVEGTQSTPSICNRHSKAHNVYSLACIFGCPTLSHIHSSSTLTLRRSVGREQACRSIVTHAESSKVVIEKSTVPVRTASSLYKILRANARSANIDFAVLSNPEFLAEGKAAGIFGTFQQK